MDYKQKHKDIVSCNKNNVKCLILNPANGEWGRHLKISQIDTFILSETGSALYYKMNAYGISHLFEKSHPSKMHDATIHVSYLWSFVTVT